LVLKLILQQFDARKKTKGPKKKSEKADNKVDSANTNDEPANNTELDNEDDLTPFADELDREEQDVADDEDDDMSDNTAADLEEIEEAMKEEIAKVAKKVKPIKRVLFKVQFISY
jgi:hypothetical protein